MGRDATRAMIAVVAGFVLVLLPACSDTETSSSPAAAGDGGTVEATVQEYSVAVQPSSVGAGVGDLRRHERRSR